MTFQGLSDLHLGDQRVTWKKVVYIVSFMIQFPASYVSWATKKKNLLRSVESWLVNRDPYNALL